MIDKDTVARIVGKEIENTDAFIVEVSVSADNRIVVEIDSTSSISIDDCAAISAAIERELDRDVEDYELEVGSAGLTSPFRVKAQYDKNIGNQVETLTAGGRKLRGTLTQAGDTTFTLSVERKEKAPGAKRPTMVSQDVSLKYDEVKYTKYIIDF